MSVDGPKQTYRDVRSESVMRSRADVMRPLLNVCPQPKGDIAQRHIVRKLIICNDVGNPDEINRRAARIDASAENCDDSASASQAETGDTCG
jgi:hypothetical protein